MYIIYVISKDDDPKANLQYGKQYI
jgi:hypothetical protein